MENYKRISFEERVKIETFNNLGWTLTAIGEKLGRNKSTISREISRYPYSYKAEKANYQARSKSRVHNYKRRLDENDRLFNFIYRYLKKRWSPQQISTYLKRKYAKDLSMHISHESIYSYIYLLPKGELKKELISYLRQEKKSRYTRKGSKDKRGKIPEMISIEEVRVSVCEMKSIKKVK